MTSPWATLRYTNKDVAPIPIKCRKFVIGRAADCDLSVSGKMVSSHHCYLELQEDGQVYLWDTSSNGTLVNKMTRLTNKQKIEIKTGDEFCIAFYKNKQNLGFVFNNLTKPDEKETPSDAQQASTQLIADDDLLEIGEEAAKDAFMEMEKSCQDETPTSPSKNVENVDRQRMKSSDDEMEDHLTCSICQAILYKCISLQPCTHCFCSGCYSEWMTLSQECPQCRRKVTRITPNYVVNNLVEAYLKQNPHKKREEDELRELDEKNKITQDMLFPKSMLYKDRGDDVYSDSDMENGYEGEDRQRYESDSDASTPEVVMHFPPSARIRYHPNQKICRQCPGKSKKPPAKKRKKENSSDNSQEDLPGCSSAGGTNDQSIEFVCTASVRHVHCFCCYEYMPDRRRDRLQNPAIPPQICSLCPSNNTYCHMYWGCKGFNCTGCLSPLENVTFDENCLSFILNNGNAYESSVLMEYVRKKNMTWRNVLHDSLDKLDAGVYQIDVTKVPRNGVSGRVPQIVVTRSTPVCKLCAYQCLAQLAYQFRRDIPADDLPTEVTERQDCYWGRNCRTQVKIHHAKNFNHICEQTRMK